MGIQSNGISTGDGSTGKNPFPRNFEYPPRSTGMPWIYSFWGPTPTFLILDQVCHASSDFLICTMREDPLSNRTAMGFSLGSLEENIETRNPGFS